MRKWKLAAGAAAGSVILAAGMFAAFNLTARAATDSCTATITSGTTPTCTFTTEADIDSPQSVTFTVDTTPGGAVVDLTYEFYCFDSQGDQLAASTINTTVDTSAGTGEESGTADVALPVTDPSECIFETATATQNVSTANDVTPPALTQLELDINYVAQTATATPSPTPSASTSSSASTTTYYKNQVHGFDGTCLDDKGNASANRTAVILWQCNDTDQAQGWSYSGSELKIHGKCLNAKGSGKQGSKLILWSCNGGANEIFSHKSSGQFVEKANGWKYCINDPGYSTKNGAQPIMYKCGGGANNHWTEP